jgi:hypothetical protein
VSFGGIDGNDSSLGDTWILNDGRWSRQVPQQDGPAARGDGSTTFVAGIINRVVIFGGDPSPSDSSQQPLCDLWTWSGSAWEEISSSGGPCLVGASAGWDGSHVVVTGGFEDLGYFKPNTDTWYFEFNGNNAGTWTKALSTVCAPLSGARGAYDPASKKFVFFGGGAYPNTFGSTLVCP